MEICSYDQEAKMAGIFKETLVVATFLALLVIGCNGKGQSAGVRESEPTPAIGTAGSPTAATREDAGTGGKAVSQQTDEARQEAPVGEEVIGGTGTQDIPDEKDRDAIIDRVDRGPGVPRGPDGGTGAGPMPGTESAKGGRTP
jgi:hypothetical protein